ncbi:hypothetical protein O9992_09110 [Vibrio lentus]|nr:hypothetical protein [Vibrio lentus]
MRSEEGLLAVTIPELTRCVPRVLYGIIGGRAVTGLTTATATKAWRISSLVCITQNWTRRTRAHHQ